MSYGCTRQPVAPASATVQAQFSVMLPVQRSDDVVLQGHVVRAREHVPGAARAVFVWCSEGACTSRAVSGKAACVSTTETGWSVIQALADSESPTSIVQTVVQMRLAPSDCDDTSAAAAARQVRGLTDAVARSFTQSAQLMHQAAEDIVIRQLMTTH